jgi:tetratricopeptide (TPR) repeat protein
MHRALNDCKKIGNLKHMTIIYDMIGITYEWRDDLKPENERNEGRFAIPYLDTCYYFAQLSGFKLYEVISLSNIGECYHHYINPPDHEKAEEYYLKALNIGAENSIYHNNAEVLAWLGELYADMGNYSKAKIYLNKALQESNEFDKQKQFTYPFFQYDRVFTDLNYSWWAKHSIYRGFMELHQYLGEFEKALTYSEKRHKTLDSLNQLKIRNQVDYMLANAENERTKQQIQLLEKENELQKNKALRSIQILAALVFVSVIMGLLLLIYIRQNKLKTEQEKINLKQKLLRSQMNPHFIFNSLASIQNAIINEDPIKASKYLSRFSKLVRNILESSVVDFIPLEEEINTIENYLALQKIRFPEKFDYSIEVDEAIDPQTVLIPPMLAQPFIENAIEHGIKHKSSKGKLVVRFKLKGGEIEYEVEDDGIGRQKAQEILHTLDHKHKSLATSITLERIIAINKNLEKKIALNIQDLYNDNKEPRGTFVMISVPLNQ